MPDLEQQERIAELTAERDNWANCYDMAVKRGQNLLSKIDELTAERDELREKNRRQRKQLSELQDAIHERNEGVLKRQWKQQVEELKVELEAQRTRANDAERGVLSEEWYVSRNRHEDDMAELKAECDDLRSRLKTQADSFQRLERENAQLRDKLERVRELLKGSDE